MDAARALVIEDDPDIADLIARYVRLVGCSVQIAHSGWEALKFADEFRPQIILLDIGLPDVDGWELARELRHRLAAVGPVLIAVSGQPKDHARLAELDIEHYLEKPAFRKDLMELLMKLVGQFDGQGLSQD